MLQRVLPAERGIPHAKDFYVTNIKATNGVNVFVAAGLEQSLLANFNFTNCTLSAENMGTLEFTKDWKFNQVGYSAVKKQPEPKKPESTEQNERQKN